jgi:hypothetical protein
MKIEMAPEITFESSLRSGRRSRIVATRQPHNKTPAQNSGGGLLGTLR